MSHFICADADDACECSGLDDECACILDEESEDEPVCRVCGYPMVRSCIACGCTDDAACPGGCHWVSDEELCCSACIAKASADRPQVTP